jgi:hypothetical protein
MTAKWTLPPPRPLAWKLKPLSSADTAFNILDDGRLELTITHGVLKGVTPSMLKWWFGNVVGSMEYMGQVYPRYLVWHPLDHIHYEVLQPSKHGTVDVGARIRIVEAFGRNPDHIVDTTMLIVQLDETGATVVRRQFGIELVRLENTFAAVPAGTQYFTCMVWGSRTWFGQMVFNRRIRPQIFSNEIARAWLRHHVEEIGNLENFLPALYALRMQQSANLC